MGRRALLDLAREGGTGGERIARLLLPLLFPCGSNILQDIGQTSRGEYGDRLGVGHERRKQGQ